MSAPKEYNSLIEEIQKAAETEPWDEELVRIVLNCTLNGGLIAIADAHNRAVKLQRKPLVDALEGLVKEYWMNKGTEHEFIACITPSKIPAYWKKASDELAKVKE
jgi:hypothetical protein